LNVFNLNVQLQLECVKSGDMITISNSSASQIMKFLFAVICVVSAVHIPRRQDPIGHQGMAGKYNKKEEIYNEIGEISSLATYYLQHEGKKRCDGNRLKTVFNTPNVTAAGKECSSYPGCKAFFWLPDQNTKDGHGTFVNRTQLFDKCDELSPADYTGSIYRIRTRNCVQAQTYEKIGHSDVFKNSTVPNRVHFPQQQLGADKSVVFSVNGTHDLSISFLGDNTYTIRIDSESNGAARGKRLKIFRNRDSLASAFVNKDTGPFLSATESRTFWADAKDGLVRLGENSIVGEQILISKQYLASDWSDADATRVSVQSRCKVVQAYINGPNEHGKSYSLKWTKKNGEIFQGLGSYCETASEGTWSVCF